MKTDCLAFVHVALNNELLFALATMLNPQYKGRLFTAVVDLLTRDLRIENFSSNRITNRIGGYDLNQIRV